MSAVGGGSSRESSGSPVEVAVAAARRLGLDVARGEVLAERSNAMVALEPVGIVARVAMDVRLAARAGHDARGAYAREVAIARRLAAGGAPVLAPSELVPPGPHDVGGRLVSFWPRLYGVRQARPEAAGRALRACRAALDQVSDLPVLWLLDEAAQLARQGPVAGALGGEAGDLAKQLDDERAALAELPLVAVHGDAGLGNALEVEGRVLWVDWEDAMLAPVLWDAACLAATSLVFGETADAHAALSGLGVDPDDPELARLVRVRVLQMVPWSALVVARGGRSRARLERRLAWLRER